MIMIELEKIDVVFVDDLILVKWSVINGNKMNWKIWTQKGSNITIMK